MLTAALLAAAAALANPTSADTLTYRIELRPGRAEVRLSIPAGVGDSLVLALPPWASVPDFAGSLDGFAVTTPAGTPVPIRREGWRWIVVTAGTAVEVRYAVPSTKTSFMGERQGDWFRPTLLPTWAFLWGPAWLVHPENAPAAAWPARMEVDAGPYVHSAWSWDAGPVLGSPARAYESLLIAGDFRRRTSRVGSLAVHFHLRGAWGFDDSVFTGSIAAILREHTRRFGAPGASDLQVVLVEGEADSHGGTVLGGAIALYPPPSRSPRVDLEALRLVSHEAFHLWNGGRLRPAPGRAEGYWKWFQEGFTEYYAWLGLMRAGLVSDTAVVDAINTALRRYTANRAAWTATADSLERYYWTSQDYRDLPYRKGLILGLVTDLSIRAASRGRRSLDDVMRGLLRAAGSTGYDAALLRTELTRIDPALESFYGEYLVGAAPLPMGDWCRELRLDCETQDVRIFDLGFESDSARVTEGARVLRVTDGSGAARAGMRPGDVLTGRVSYWSGDPTRQAMIEVRRATGETAQLAYLPSQDRRMTLLSLGPATRARLELLAR